MAFEVTAEQTPRYNLNANGNFAFSSTVRYSGNSEADHDVAAPGQALTFYQDETSLRCFIKAAPHPIVVTSSGGAVEFCNAYAAELFGYTEAELEGKVLSALVDLVPRAHSVPHLASVAGALIAHAGQAIETTARRKSGEVFPVELGSSELLLSSRRVVIHFVRDISHRQRFEQRILELQRELMHLSQQNVLGELASAITHELNQPLTAITNYAAAARQCGCTASPEGLEAGFELMEKAAGQAVRAGQIVHKLRNLVRHHGVECADGDLRVVLEDAVQLATMGAAECGIRVSVSMPEEPVAVIMDRVPVQILLTNLVRNAVDALCSVKGEKKVTVTLRVLDSNVAEVSVEDTGVGIAPEVFESIFDPFHTTKPDGLGMGLAICRRIAEAHDGRLAAANRPEGGAIFSFIVPLSNKK